MKKGFTLVELSIVLVIVGLLIGGILVAQSMIGTAKLQGQIAQLQQFDIATRNFKTAYNALPGDYGPFSGNNSGYSGNSNGIINNFSNTTPYTDYSTWGESYAFFPSIYKAGMIKDPYDILGFAAYYVSPGSPFPRAKLASKANYGIVVRGNANGQVFWNLAVSANVGATNHQFDLISPTGILSAANSLALNAKIDNGVPNTGNTVATGTDNKCNDCSTTNGVPYAVTSDGSNGGCILTAGAYKYNITNSSETACRILVKSEATP